MKNNIYIIAFLMIGSLVISCSTDYDLNYQNNYEESHKAWLDFKKLSGNSYQYTVVGSSWTGFRWETTITILKGEAVERHFKFSDPDDVPDQNVEWIEKGQEVGSHQDQAAEALTLDEIYAKVKKEWLIKRENAKVYFETDYNGLISTCGYVENGCMDDCFVGIKIKNIERLSP